jgi:hypothetical protein
MEAFEVLVVILSVVLSIFLLVAIIFTVYLIRIARRVHEISEKARAAASSMEAAAHIFKKTAGPAVFSRIVANIVESWQAKKKDKRS